MNSLSTWLRYDGGRGAVAALLVSAVPITILGLAVSGLVDVTTAYAGSSDSVETLFQALVTSVITGVTLVVTISQLVLSQELGPLGDQASRMSDAMDVRRRVEDHLPDVDVAAAQTSTFLGDLVRSASACGERLLELADDQPGDLTDDVRQLGQAVVRDADHVADALEEATFGTFGVVRASLDLHYSPVLQRARRLLHRTGPELTDEAREAVEHLAEGMELFASVREHVKTLYFQWDLISLSRTIMFWAMPSLATSIGVLLFFERSTLSRHALLGLGADAWVLVATVTVAVLPFAVLLSYMLRIVTVARRTLAIGPFVLLDEDRELLDRGRG